VNENEIGDGVINAAMRVHSVVGPGLLESAYEACLRHELEKRELHVRTQVLLPVRYDDLILEQVTASICLSRNWWSSN
jgi:GxxExxY protein